jgi:hypothetical protein
MAVLIIAAGWWSFFGPVGITAAGERVCGAGRWCGVVVERF